VRARLSCTGAPGGRCSTVDTLRAGVAEKLGWAERSISSGRMSRLSRSSRRGLSSSSLPPYSTTAYGFAGPGAHVVDEPIDLLAPGGGQMPAVESVQVRRWVAFGSSPGANHMTPAGILDGMRDVTTIKVSVGTRDALRQLADLEDLTLDAMIGRLIRHERRRLIGSQLASAPLDDDDRTVLDASASDVSPLSDARG